MSEWRPVPGWEAFYEVSDEGLVRSLPRVVVQQRKHGPKTLHFKPKIRAGSINNGYPRIPLKGGGRVAFPYVHQIVCEAFHGPQPDGCEVAHNDGNPLNCCAENVRWATPEENNRDKVKHGTQPRGEQIWLAKLTEAQARAILQSSIGPRPLARQMGVSPSAISDIRHGRTWKHLQGAV